MISFVYKSYKMVQIFVYRNTNALKWDLLQNLVETKFWVLIWVPKKVKAPIYGAFRGVFVPGAGIEPARVTPLVFETSTSTYSAIRALFFCIISHG